MSDDINAEKLDPSQEKPNPNSLINPQKNVPNPPMTYTPLSQNAQPFISKRMKNIKMKKANELINKAEIKRSNYIKKNEFNESPIFSYFNSSQKYLSEEYAKNSMNLNKENEVEEIDDDSQEENDEESSENDEEVEKKKILNKIFRIETIFIISIK